MKIIGFNGSPRISGGTAWAVSKVLEGAKLKGATTKLFSAGELDIRPCSGCLGCIHKDCCVMMDDMQKVYDDLRESEALVFGTPVYMGQMSAQAKAFTDRLFAHHTPRFSPRFKEEYSNKKLVLLFTQGNPDRDKFKVYYDYTRDMFEMLEFVVEETVVIANTRTEPAFRQKEIPIKLQSVGFSLVESIRKI
ncbi:MAG: flavodoxin family protein [Oscillospiraceae bacterium]|jgi:multimeric flavodoxin WrbA|nr:flavodoxin family protein [Oscillospiraceae bacterium]